MALPPVVAVGKRGVFPGAYVREGDEKINYRGGIEMDIETALLLIVTAVGIFPVLDLLAGPAPATMAR